jgi:hypothetical protein
MDLLSGPQPIVEAQPWYPPKLQEFTPAEALAEGLVYHADAVEMGYITDTENPQPPSIGHNGGPHSAMSFCLNAARGCRWAQSDRKTVPRSRTW